MKMPSRVAQTMPQMNMKNCVVSTFNGIFYFFNRCRRKRSKVDASICDSALSHTRCSDASEKRVENSVSTFGRFRLWTSFEAAPVSVKMIIIC